jgi:hypothetical protein
VVPDHTQETLTNYLINGYEPGGFVSAMLAMDLERALYNADVANKRCLWEIGRWICEYAPQGSWGNYDLIKAWCRNDNNRRTSYAKEIEKEHIMQVLKDGVE